MVKKLVFTDADFSANAIPADPRLRLRSSMLVQGLIAESGGIRSVTEYMNRASKITLTSIDEYSSITIPTGMQWCACFFKEDGTPPGQGSATWMKNETGSAQTYRFDSAANFLNNTFRYCTIGLGYISGDTLPIAAFDVAVEVYLVPAIPTPEELRITSSMVEEGMMNYSDGSINTTPPSMDKRLSYRTVTYLTDYSRISIPSGIKWAVLYMNPDGTVYNPSEALNQWTETPGSSGGGIVNITSALKQDHTNSAGPCYYLTFGNIDNTKLNPSDLDSTYEIKLLR